MSFRSAAKNFIVRVLIPILFAFAMTASVFVGGMRVGANMQSNQDAPFFEECAKGYEEMKQLALEKTGDSCGLTEDKRCTQICQAVSKATDNLLESVESYKSPEGSCSCFFNVGSNQ